MRRIWKVVLLVVLVLFVLGLALTAVSAMTGGSISRIKTNMAIRDFDEVFINKITDLDIDLSTGVLRIVEGTAFRVEAKNIAEEYFVCEVNNGKLRVAEDFRDAPSFNVVRGLNLLDYTPEITISIPRGFVADSVDLEIAAGRGEIANLVADKISISISAGECRIDSIEAVEADFDIAAGSFTVYSMDIDNCDFDVSAGNAYLGGIINKEANIDCSAGKIEIQLSGLQEDYSFDVDVGAGRISLGSDRYSGVSSRTALKGKDGSAKLDLNCTAGEIIVGFTG